MDFNEYSSLFCVDSLKRVEIKCQQIETCFEMCAKFIEVHNSKLAPKINDIDNYLYLKDPQEYYLQLFLAKSESGIDYAWVNCIHKTVRSAEVMLLEALRLSDDEFGFTNFNVNEFVNLTDEYVLSTLISSKSSKLKRASQLAQDYKNRKKIK